MREMEELIITVSDAGYGQLCSSYDYRITGRGGKGIGNMNLGRGDDSRIVASFRLVPETDELVLVSSAGQIIRAHANEISPKRRGSMGVRIFDVGADQKVVSVARLRDAEGGDDEEGEGEVGEDDGTETEASEVIAPGEATDDGASSPTEADEGSED